MTNANTNAVNLTATEVRLLEQAELRTRNNIKLSYFGFIQANIKELVDTGSYTDKFSETIRNVEKTFHFVLSILGDYVIVSKTAESGGAKGKGCVFKIALSEFESVPAQLLS